MAFSVKKIGREDVAQGKITSEKKERVNEWNVMINGVNKNFDAKRCKESGNDVYGISIFYRGEKGGLG